MQKIEYKAMGEELFFEELPNHMKVFIMPKKGYMKSYAIFATDYGSNDLTFLSPFDGKEVRVNEGIAHFLEHKMFEQEDGSDAFAEFSKYGANANAFTNFNMTAYLFSTTHHLTECLEHLISYVQAPYFTKENVEKEKGIIAQEIRMYDDNPQWQLFFQSLQGMYHVHTTREDIAGTVESIYRITPEELYTCYNSFYSPSNMALFVIGDVDPEAVLSTVKGCVKDTNAFEGTIVRLQEAEPEAVATPYLSKAMDVSVPMFSLNFKDERREIPDGPQLLRRSLEIDLILDILFGPSSELNESLFEQQLIHDDLSYGYNGMKDYGYSSIDGESVQYEAVVDQILAEIERRKTAGFETKEFEREKKRRIGAITRSYDSIESIANGFISDHFLGIPFFDTVDILKSITLEDLERRLEEHFISEARMLSVIEKRADEQVPSAG